MANENTSDQYTFQDPVNRYPSVSPPKQDQPEPGLDADLEPKTDRGEDSYRGTGRLEGRKALITGADSGIGAAVAIAFAREGADVALSYLPEEEEDAAKVIQLIKDAGRTAVALPGDLRDAGYCTQVVEDAVKGLGGLDILVNNAGKQVAVENLEDLSDEQLDDTFKTNIYSFFRVTKAALPHLRPDRASSTPPPSRPTAPLRTCWTTPAPRRRSTTSPRGWASSWHPRASG